MEYVIFNFMDERKKFIGFNQSLSGEGRLERSKHESETRIAKKETQNSGSNEW
jgi:hypothetical protein